MVVAVGPLAGLFIEVFEIMGRDERPNLWAVSELPLERNPLPGELATQIAQGPGLFVAEEHVRRGSFGSELALHLAERGISARRFHHLHASAHHFDRYGSQSFMRRRAGIDAESMLAALAAH